MNQSNKNILCDLQKYHSDFIKFLNDMYNLKNESDPCIKEILKNLCITLGISKIEVYFYENVSCELSSNGNYMCLYSIPQCNDNDDFIQYRYVTENDNVAIYKVYSIQNAQWTDFHKNEINTIINTIFSYHGRIRVMRIAKQYMFEDVEFGIYNIRYFMKFVGQKIAQNQIKDYISSVYNIKRMTIINESIGRDKSTQIMIQHAKTLENIIGKDGCVCRLGGDNFVILFKRELLDDIRKYFKGHTFIYDETNNESITISVTAGFNVIANMPEVHNPSEVMEGAYVSANLAKRSSNTDEIFWSNSVMLKQLSLKRIENIFPSALLNEEFKVYYQPKISIKTDYKLTGAEALCRWFHDDSMVYPNEFIPVLEQSSNICKLDFYILEHVCMDIRRWLDEGKNVVKISVNFSRKHLTDRCLLDNIVKIIDKHNVPHEYIEIELTETTTDVDFKDLKYIVNGLHEFNISTSVDDFGIGYSSLNLIRDIPWDVLKIDKSFLPELHDIDNTAAKKNIMLKYVLSMAHELGLECIVEGVETEEHIKLLKDNGCYLAQGYYFDRPLPCDIFERKL